MQRLVDLRSGAVAMIEGLDRHGPGDLIATRMHELGFIAGESVTVLALGPFGGDPLMVRIAGARFARCLKLFAWLC